MIPSFTRPRALAEIVPGSWRIICPTGPDNLTLNSLLFHQTSEVHFQLKSFSRGPNIRNRTIVIKRHF